MPLTDEQRERLVFTRVADVALCADVKDRRIHQWIDLGMPREEVASREYRYRIDDIFAWYVKKFPKGVPANLSSVEGGDVAEALMMAAGGNTPSLERWRVARAKLAERDLAERDDEICRIDVMLELLMRLAGEMRQQVIVALEKRFGNEAGDYVKDWLRRFLRRVEDEFAAQFPRAEANSVDVGLPADTEGEADQPMGGGGDLGSPRGAGGDLPTLESSGE